MRPHSWTDTKAREIVISSLLMSSCDNCLQEIVMSPCSESQNPALAPGSDNLSGKTKIRSKDSQKPVCLHLFSA